MLASSYQPKLTWKVEKKQKIRKPKRREAKYKDKAGFFRGKKQIVSSRRRGTRQIPGEARGRKMAQEREK